MSSARLQRVLDRIDRLNREDPNTEPVGGVARPRELAYAERLTGWVLRLDPNPSEALRIAARGQHVQRWTIPRDRYERTRRGYLRWRETLKTFHAETVGGLMRGEGYPEEEIARVRRLMSKRELGTDPETQTLEDALCLVFLETQFADLRRKEPEDKMVEILRKTWQKMSPRARTEALALPFGNEERQVLGRALNQA
jgi:hypothetical protein